MKSNSEIVYEDLIGRGRRLETARQWRGVVRRFEECCGIKASYERGDIVKFVAKLREDGMKQSSINMLMRPLRLLSVLQKWEDGFPNICMPKVRRCDVSRPMFNIDEMRELILKGRKVCSERELAFMAVASTYGLRREEIGSLEFVDGVVRVNTLKGGEVTDQLIPDEIRDFLKGYRGSNDARYVTRVFRNIVNKVGIEVGVGFGWHSIRRALATELLLCDVSLWNIVRFMRWSDASLQREVGMLAIYAQKEQSRVDGDVFKVHPFLPFWDL